MLFVPSSQYLDLDLTTSDLLSGEHDQVRNKNLFIFLRHHSLVLGLNRPKQQGKKLPAFRTLSSAAGFALSSRRTRSTTLHTVSVHNSWW